MRKVGSFSFPSARSASCIHTVTQTETLAWAGAFVPALAVSLCLFGSCRTCEAADGRPNIVLIMADDMGFSDLGCYGAEIATPNIDSLAERGVRFSQFYNCGRCCPTRASLLTGLCPHQAGIGYMEPMNKYNRPIKHLPEYQGFLNDRGLTIAEVLRSAGYQTCMAGKWHVGSEEGQRPLDRGFDRFFGLLGGACNFFRPREGQIVNQDKPVWPLSEDFYTTDYFAAYAARFIAEANRDRPFFLYLAFTAPHWPLHAWPEDIAKYRGRYRNGWDALRQQRFAAQKARGLFDPNTRLSPRHKDSYDWSVADQDDMDLRMAVYAAMIDRMDQGVGTVLRALRESDCSENTMIFMLSDNGGCAEPLGKARPNARPAGPADSFTGYLLPWANASNTPFRLFKHWVHEGGIASPLIVSWPRGVATDRQGDNGRGRICHVPAHVIDIMATCVDLANAQYPHEIDGKPIMPMEGRSLRPLFAPTRRLPDSSSPRDLFWEHEGNRAVRAGRWKLVSYYNAIHEAMDQVGTGRRTGPWELYDLETDRTELRDLAEENSAKVQELSAKYSHWADRVGVCDWQSLLRMGGYDATAE